MQNDDMANASTYTEVIRRPNKHHLSMIDASFEEELEADRRGARHHQGRQRAPALQSAKERLEVQIDQAFEVNAYRLGVYF